METEVSQSTLIASHRNGFGNYFMLNVNSTEYSLTDEPVKFLVVPIHVIRTRSYNRYNTNWCFIKQENGECLFHFPKLNVIDPQGIRHEKAKPSFQSWCGEGTQSML